MGIPSMVLDSNGAASDMSDSIYKEAVTKLKILLSATDPSTRNDGDSLREPKSGKRNQISKSLDHLNDLNGVENEKPYFQRKSDPNFTRLPPRPNHSVRRQLFQSPSKPLGSTHTRNNSWHNLTFLDTEQRGVDRPSTTTPRLQRLAGPESPSRSPAVRELLQRQELYIEQLEKENAFCNDQLSKILLQVKQVLVANSNEAAEEKSKKDELIELLKHLDTTMKTRDNVQIENMKFQEENTVLRQKISETKESSQDQDNERCISELRKEVEFLKARESEAAEQVQKSVKIAEQIKQQKSEAEFEIEQLSGQVERQQGKIRSLIEEQVNKVEEERLHIERRYKEQTEALKRELQSSLEETGRLTAISEKLVRSENELKRQIEEKEKTVTQVNNLCF